jgi:hypothetical protein
MSFGAVTREVAAVWVCLPAESWWKGKGKIRGANNKHYSGGSSGIGVCAAVVISRNFYDQWRMALRKIRQIRQIHNRSTCKFAF